MATATVSEPRYAVGQKALADILGVTTRTIQNYKSDGMPGPDDQSRYDVAKCKAWREENIRDREELDVSELKEALIRAELAKTEAQAAKLQLANAKEAGELMYVADARQAMAERAIRIRLRLEACPQEMEMTFPEATRAQNVADFENYIHLLLKEMAAWALEVGAE